MFLFVFCKFRYDHSQGSDLRAARLSANAAKMQGDLPVARLSTNAAKMQGDLPVARLSANAAKKRSDLPVARLSANAARKHGDPRHSTMILIPIDRAAAFLTQ